jgi:hypothetical protein
MFKPRLFTYPDYSKSNTVFDSDDLEQQDALLILCVRANPELDIEEDAVYVWKGYEFEDEGDSSGGSLSKQEYIDKVIE